MAYRESFRVPTGGIGVGWCLTDCGQQPRVPLQEPTRVLAPDDTVRAQYAANLRERFVDKLAGQENPWWIGSGGRSALNLHVLAYCHERLGRDPRVLTQVAKAVSAICAPSGRST